MKKKLLLQRKAIAIVKDSEKEKGMRCKSKINNIGRED
jgi:hypothetical protein